MQSMRDDLDVQRKAQENAVLNTHDPIREELRQKERSENVILSGIKEQSGENLREKVASLLPEL